MSLTNVILRKELHELTKNRAVVASLLLPMLIFALLPLIAQTVQQLSLAGPMSNIGMEAGLEQMVTTFPQLAQLTGDQQIIVLLLRQFNILFLMLPIITSLSLATYSIIGEKQSGSLEPLLASPAPTHTIFLGKSIAIVLPAVLATWFGFGVYAWLASQVHGTHVLSYSIDGATWLMIATIVPLLALFALSIGSIVSSRVTEPRAAQQIGAVFVLPIVGLVVTQSAGLFMLGVNFVLAGAVFLMVCDLLVLFVGIRLFDRERILTKWKR